MLVDDSAVARHKVGAILCSLKCEVIEAKDGTEALSTLEKETPDLLILDINMPCVTSLDVLTQACSAASGHAHGRCRPEGRNESHFLACR